MPLLSLPRCVAAAAYFAQASVAVPPVTTVLMDDEGTCPGSVDVTGLGPVEIVATKWNYVDENVEDPAGTVAVVDGKIVSNMKGRSYFANKCEPGKYDPTDYVPLQLLGKSLRFTVDLSGIGCGCNAAFYLTSMAQNTELSMCKDYYCDANSVCGEMCTEIDIMESSELSWHSTLHSADDKYGVAVGYGGGSKDWSGPRDFNATDYGPGAQCIDTKLPFNVSASFPVDGWGILAEMRIDMWQEGKPCNISVGIDQYDGNTTKHAAKHNDGMPELTEALRLGMTPIVSFWEAEDMLWLDGKGADGQGPCSEDLVVACPDSYPIYNFELVDLPPVPLLWKYWLVRGVAGVGILGVLAGVGVWYQARTSDDHSILEESDVEENSE